MTKAQKVILIITVALVVLSFVFPHWKSERGGWASFFPVFYPPQRATDIDFQKTCTQAVVILIFGAILLLLIEKIIKSNNSIKRVKIKKRAVIIVCSICLILLSYLFPCWQQKKSGVIVQTKQFHFIFNPPYKMSVDYKQLQYQIAVIVLITIGLVYMVRDK